MSKKEAKKITHVVRDSINMYLEQKGAILTKKQKEGIEYALKDLAEIEKRTGAHLKP